MKPTPAVHGGPSLLAVLALCLAVLSTACQSQPTPKGAAGPEPSTATLTARPRPVVVHDFAFDRMKSHGDPGVLSAAPRPVRRVQDRLSPAEPPETKAARLSELLSTTIARELADLRIPAYREPTGAPMPQEGLVVTGEFLEVDEGNRLKRAVVGFGAGGTDVLVSVSVYDLAHSRDQPVLMYGTGTGSRSSPGGLISLNPYAMAAKYVLSRNATEKDVRRLGRQIARDLAQLEAADVR